MLLIFSNIFSHTPSLNADQKTHDQQDIQQDHVFHVHCGNRQEDNNSISNQQLDNLRTLEVRSRRLNTSDANMIQTTQIA